MTTAEALLSGTHAENGVDPADLISASDEYSERWYRPLTEGEELRDAHKTIAAMRDAALGLSSDWDVYAAQLPSSDEVQSAIPSPSGASRLVRPFLDDASAEQIIDLVGRFNRFTNRGHELLRAIRPAVVYVRHFEREATGRELNGRADPTIRRESVAAREDIELLQRRVAGDVDSQRSQIEILSMYTQMALAKRVTDLTRVLAALTLLLVVVTFAVLAISVFNAFFGG